MICPLPTSLSPRGSHTGRAQRPIRAAIGGHVEWAMYSSSRCPHYTTTFRNCVPLDFCGIQFAQLYEAALGPWKVWLGKGREPLSIPCWCKGAAENTELGGGRVRQGGKRGAGSTCSLGPAVLTHPPAHRKGVCQQSFKTISVIHQYWGIWPPVMILPLRRNSP